MIKSLQGRRIVVTRARYQAAELCDGLRLRGALPIELPTIELRDPESFESLDRAVAELERYDWILFTSANAVEKFFARMNAAGRTASGIRGRVCAIGPATAAELIRFGVQPDRSAAEYRGEGLLEALAGQDLAGKRILIPRAAVARDLLPRELAARGARVDVAEAYRTVAPEIPQAVIAGLLKDPPDLITFTSSSTAINCPAELRGLRAASIGPITTETARRRGFNVVAEARESTVAGLLDALEEYFLNG